MSVLMRVRGVWRDMGIGYLRDVEGPSHESDSPNLTKEEDAKLSAFLDQYVMERQVRKWGLSPVSSHGAARRGADGRFS